MVKAPPVCHRGARLAQTPLPWEQGRSHHHSIHMERIPTLPAAPSAPHHRRGRGCAHPGCPQTPRPAHPDHGKGEKHPGNPRGLLLPLPSPGAGCCPVTRQGRTSSRPSEPAYGCAASPCLPCSPAGAWGQRSLRQPGCSGTESLTYFHPGRRKIADKGSFSSGYLKEKSL